MEATESICSRNFEDEDGIDIVVTIYKPFFDTKRYVCHFEIVGLINNVSSKSYGIDDMQAICVAFMTIRTILNSEKYTNGKKIFWNGGENLGLLSG